MRKYRGNPTSWDYLESKINRDDGSSEIGQWILAFIICAPLWLLWWFTRNLFKSTKKTNSKNNK
tara:strand:+ start:388 stop:579 length:192 start_codon:yes stop_codon:yes gene_type:complete